MVTMRNWQLPILKRYRKKMRLNAALSICGARPLFFTSQISKQRVWTGPSEKNEGSACDDVHHDGRSKPCFKRPLILALLSFILPTENAVPAESKKTQEKVQEEQKEAQEKQKNPTRTKSAEQVNKKFFLLLSCFIFANMCFFYKIRPCNSQARKNLS